MSEAKTAASPNLGEDCPLCLEPLPPFWDIERRVTTLCCAKSMCKNCDNKEEEFLQRARAEGTYGRQERQLASTCPLCRSEMPDSGNIGRMLRDRFEQGQLPLKMYYSLGTRLAKGHGVERNVERGMKIMMLGAEKGDPNCQYMLGGMYYEGVDGLPKSGAEAKRWVVAATEQGHAIAEYNLAIMFRDEGNNAECLRHMRGSASKGYNLACNHLGVVYYNGESGVQKSAEEAIRWLTPAAERGDANSMGLLGTAMLSPDSRLQSPLLPQDNPNFTRGVHWLQRAAATGNEDCVRQWKSVEEWTSKWCFRCDKVAARETSFLRCSRCRAAWYCSKGCQVQHWKALDGGHKQFCIKWK